MKRLDIKLCGRVKIVECPWKKVGFEPAMICVDCNYGSKIDYAGGFVDCKYSQEIKKNAINQR